MARAGLYIQGGLGVGGGAEHATALCHIRPISDRAMGPRLRQPTVQLAG